MSVGVAPIPSQGGRPTDGEGPLRGLATVICGIAACSVTATGALAQSTPRSGISNARLNAARTSDLNRQQAPVTVADPFAAERGPEPAAAFAGVSLDGGITFAATDSAFGPDIEFQPAQQAAFAGADPFSRRDGWASHGEPVRRFGLVFQDQPHEARLLYRHDGSLQLSVGEHSGALQWRALPQGLEITFAGQRLTVQVDLLGDVAHVFAAAGATRITVVDLLAHAGESQSEGGRLTAPMPGKVVSFAVKAGDKVSKGQALAVMEAMKMEHTIAAPADGVVQELLFAPGDQVGDGAELLRLVAAA